jgi:AcrR family transcriptional regulator
MEVQAQVKREDGISLPAGRPRGRPKTVSDEVRRDGIIVAARAIFHELGYAGTTMDLVAARCRISKQTLYRLFSGKTELFMAIMADHRASMLALPRDEAETLPLAAALERIFMIDIDEEAERDREAFIHLIMSEAQRFPEMATLLRIHGVEQSRQMLADWLLLQHRRGRIMLSDAFGGARMLMDMIFGAMVSLPGYPNEWPDREGRQQHLRQCIAIFLTGVGAGTSDRMTSIA